VIGSTHSAETAPRRRSVHFVPGGNDRFLAKALASDADTLVLDLEDSVPPDRKDTARSAVVDWLGGIDAGGKELMVRINGVDTPWAAADVGGVVPAGARSLMVPKVDGAAELRALDEHVDPCDPEVAVSYFPVATETPAGVFGLPELGRHPRVDGLCWGAEDLSAALGGGPARDGAGHLLPVYVTVRSWCLLGAAAGGIQAVDAVFTDLGDRDGLRREAEEAAAMGYAGKITIHPDQIDVVNEAFTPTDEEVAGANALLAAFEANRAEGRYAFTFEGQMVDAPHLTRARRLLARAGIDPDRPGGNRP
jgi:citrate lyase subunit beta/citryl-CoA lyase